MSARPPVSVIVLTLNGSDVIRGCLDSLLAGDFPDPEIIVVNNGSTDETPRIVADEYPGVRLINLPRNLGYAGGINEGIKASHGDILILLNDDTVTMPSMVRCLAEPFAGAPEVGIVGCKILYPDGVTIQHAGGEILANGCTRHLGYGERDEGQHDAPRDVDYVTGCAIAVRRSLFEELGLYDDRYFPTYYEETEFAVRARRAGYRILYTPRAALHHLESKTEVIYSQNFFFRNHRSRLRFMLKNFSLGEMLRAVRPELRYIKFANKRTEGRALARAYVHALIRLPWILWDRNHRFLPLEPRPPRRASPMPDRDVKQFQSDKILKHLDRVNDWLEGRNPPPVTVELDMTNICTHRCPECVVNYFRRRDQVSLPGDLAPRIIDQLAEAGVRGLIFTGGGEPLCHRDTPAMIERAADRGMDVALITNGSLLTDEIMRLALARCVWIRVSLDGATPRSFQAMHGMNDRSFEKVVENVKRLAELKRETGGRATVGVGVLTCEETAGEMDLAAGLCREWGVDYIQFRPLQIRDGDEFGYDWSDVEERIDRARRHACDGYDVLYSKHKYDSIKRRDYGRDYGACHGQQFASTVAADGKVYVCCHLRGYEKYCLGDLNEQSFEDIWNGDRRQEVIANIDFKDCIPLCRDNTFNQILWRIAQPRVHENFL